MYTRLKFGRWLSRIPQVYLVQQSDTNGVGEDEVTVVGAQLGRGRVALKLRSLRRCSHRAGRGRPDRDRGLALPKT